MEVIDHEWKTTAQWICTCGHVNREKDQPKSCWYCKKER